MKRSEKINSYSFGTASGVVIPLILFLLFYFWKGEGRGIIHFFNELVIRDVLSNTISVAVFANVFAFILFNQFNMLRASRGLLGITIIWAIVVFIIKLA